MPVTGRFLQGVGSVCSGRGRLVTPGEPRNGNGGTGGKHSQISPAIGSPDDRCDVGRPWSPDAPEGMRERYGDRYHVVELHDGIKLVPAADDPLDAPGEEFAGVETTVGELRDEARSEALDEAGR